QLFNIILMFGAGTGLIFILRWFWWRINAWSEISAMFSSGIISILFNFTSLGVVLFGTAEADGVLPYWSTYPVVVLLTSIVWLAVTFLTRPEKDKTLFDFYKQTQPGGPGWEKIIIKARAQGAALVTTNQKWSVPAGILATLVGCVTIYGALFSTGYWIYGYYTQASILTLLTLIATIALVKLWQRIKTRVF
ncbi:MAG TPA: Na+:solute symporter, partial [Leeuwenhoekiella sp.]|nr:Na+:solute symporter [Leeuwenhoekiella sp.]